MLAIISLLNVSIIEGQKVNGLFNLTKDIIQIINNNEKWIVDFLLFLFNLLKLIGYEIDFTKNLANSYFNLDTLQFESVENMKSIKFPHTLLTKQEKINYESAISFFKIFETILQNYHLNNMNLIMPNNYLNFKQLILKFLRK